MKTKTKIKLIGLLLCFVATAMMVSCNKDDESIDENASIVASWKCTYSSTYYEYSDDYGEWQGAMKENKYKDDIMTLSEDGKVFVYGSEIGTYIKASSTIIFDCSRMVDGLYQILTLTQSKLKIKLTGVDDDEWCDVFEFERM